MQAMYITDDRDYPLEDQRALVISMGGNGDWYVQVTGVNGRSTEGVRLCTSGGASSNVPGLTNAIAEAYRCMMAAQNNAPREQRYSESYDRLKAEVDAWRKQFPDMQFKDEVRGFEMQEPFQERAQSWMEACFSDEVINNPTERNHRFIEESLELAQARGATIEEVHQLADYVFNRPIGEVKQEVGGVIITLSALCSQHGVDFMQCGETELARVWDNVEKIRSKQKAKPNFYPKKSVSP